MSKNEKVQDAMNHILECEPDTPLEAIQEEIGQVANAILFEDQPTVKSVLQKLNELNKSSGASEGEELHVSPMFLDFANGYVKQLSELLGIDLEG